LNLLGAHNRAHLAMPALAMSNAPFFQIYSDNMQVPTFEQLNSSAIPDLLSQYPSRDGSQETQLSMWMMQGQ
jgi:hypothetical protein